MNKTDDFNVLTITHPDVENGKGCRVTIWCAGCTHNCPGCHNKHTWAYNQGHSITESNVKEEIYKAVDKDYIQGITFSGGDPLDQSYIALKELYMFITEFKIDFPDKDIWIYTGGLFEDLVKVPIIRKILNKCDVLVDGPFVQELYDPDLTFRGSTNQRIIQLKGEEIRSILIGIQLNYCNQFIYYNCKQLNTD